MINAIDLMNPMVASSVILSVPHGGTDVPAWCRRGLLFPAEDLWSDWYTRQLYDLSDRLALPLLRTRLSRFVADPNRALTAPLHGDFWATAVPAADPWGRPVYSRPLSSRQVTRRIAVAHRPYHQALDSLVSAALSHHSAIVLLDLHSFGIDLSADVILGDRNGTTADAATSDRVATAFTQAGFTVTRNHRFTGGFVVRRFTDHGRVHAIQVELSQRCYLRADDVDAGRPHPRVEPVRWQRTQQMLLTALQTLGPHDPAPRTGAARQPRPASTRPRRVGDEEVGDR
jgi:N-formylglutamate deformylase